MSINTNIHKISNNQTTEVLMRIVKDYENRESNCSDIVYKIAKNKLLRRLRK